MIEVSVALREGGDCPQCYGLVNISVALQWGLMGAPHWGVSGGRLPPKQKKVVTNSAAIYSEGALKKSKDD